MTIRVNCPKCNGILEAGEGLLGEQARCPYCQHVFKVGAVLPPAGAMPATGNGPMGSENPRNPPTVSGGGGGEKGKPQPASAAPKGPKPGPKPTGAPSSHVTRLPGEPMLPPAHPARESGPKPLPEAVPVDDGPGPADGPVGYVLAEAGHHRHKRSQLMMLWRSLVRRGNPTDASVVLTGIAAAAATWLIYRIIIWPMPESRFRELFAERSWIQYATVYFTVWAAVVLAVKFWKIASQQTSLTYDLLGVDRAKKITPGNANFIENHIKKLPINPRRSFLVQRLLMALENFKARKSVPEVGAVLNSQAETDGALVDSSYAMLKVLIWAIPILGFLGTVIGISDAVNHFTEAVRNAEDLKQVKEALGKVTQGLAVAFDTTLLGLILSMVIMFPTNWVQKTEEDMLSAIDQYCTENLLPRLSTDGERGESTGRQAEQPTLLDPYVQLLQDWQKRLENLETALFEKVTDTLSEVRKELAKERPLPEEV